MLSVTPRQLRLWLFRNKGVTDDMVYQLISTLPSDGTREEAEIEWEYASNYYRDHPMFDTLGGLMGMTPEQITGAFEQAAQL